MFENFENEESISVEKILELALMYINESELTALVRPQNLFALFSRSISVKKNEDWCFDGYGLLVDYTINNAEKPIGKWINVKYIYLNTFPPQAICIRLQPPHIAKGYYQNFDRTCEFKSVAIISEDSNKNGEIYREQQVEAENLQFPTTKRE
jgi:hypothetical protein